MKLFNLFLLIILPIGVYALAKSDLEGTWYRNYGVYRPWLDTDQGVVLYYEEDLIFRADNTVFIYDDNTKIFKGKSMYALTIRNGKDFLVFYNSKMKNRISLTLDAEQ